LKVAGVAILNLAVGINILTKKTLNFIKLNAPILAITMNQRFNQFVQNLKEELSFFFSISLGVFLFILFFQPFPLSKFDFNNNLLFVAGLAGIIFLFMILSRLATPLLIKNYTENKQEHLFISYVGGFLILALCSTAFAFYLRYVGEVAITFHAMFKVILICIFPLTAFRLNDRIKELKKENEALKMARETMQIEVNKYEEDILNKAIELSSENYTDRLQLIISEIALIKSADNYVEIVYNEDNTLKKKLIRNTLKNIEHQLSLYSNFIRCHRICIVNKHYVVGLNKNYNKHWLIIKGYEEEIPVSRQYLLKLREIL